MSDIKKPTFFEQEKTHDLDKVAKWAGKKKVLVLDDDPAIASVVKTHLEENGYEVDCVSDGVDGIKKIMVHDYAVILCDMVMPHLPGDMFYVAVERVKPHLCRRFLFMTGHSGSPKVDEFIRRVKGLMLWKPFKLHVLMESIQAAEGRGAKTA